MSTFSDYYKILECDSNASLSELKRKYQELILIYHPDKQTDKSEHFLLIDEAWKVLRDPEQRRIYDARLLQTHFNEQPLLFDTLTLSDLEEHQDANLGIIYSYPCRCGGTYKISPSDISSGECLVNCEECSLLILVRQNYVCEES